MCHCLRCHLPSWKRENLGRSDDAKQRKKRGWPNTVEKCSFINQNKLLHYTGNRQVLFSAAFQHNRRPETAPKEVLFCFCLGSSSVHRVGKVYIFASEKPRKCESVTLNENFQGRTITNPYTDRLTDSSLYILHLKL